MDFQWDVFAAIMVACVVAAFIAVMWRKGSIGNVALSALSTLISSQAESMTGNGIVSLMAKYSAIAVRAVEQLALSGQIDKDSATKKETAIELAESYAVADGIELSQETVNALPSLIEEAVHTMNKAE